MGAIRRILASFFFIQYEKSQVSSAYCMQYYMPGSLGHEFGKLAESIAALYQAIALAIAYPERSAE